MRITTQAKEETRKRILDAAKRLFGKRGFASTSTRELASATGIAVGTLFNYFPSKESLAMSLVADALGRGTLGFDARRRGAESLEEDLFAFVAAGLRELEPYRAFLGDVVETGLSPFGRSAAAREGDDLRADHLETVGAVLADHGMDGALGAVSIHLYWTLYLGVLAFWSKDDSPKQEDTLVVLDQSLRLFVASITESASSESEASNGPESS